MYSEPALLLPQTANNWEEVIHATLNFFSGLGGQYANPIAGANWKFLPEWLF